MKVRDYLLEKLRANGVHEIFTLPAYYILDMTTHFHNNGMKIIEFRSEYNASFAAVSFSAITNRLGVLCVNTGPSFTNALTGIKTAQKERIPLLVIVGIQPIDTANEESFFQTINIQEHFSGKIFCVDKNGTEAIDKCFEALSYLENGPVILQVPIDSLDYYVEPTTNLTIKSLQQQHSIHSPEIKREINMVLRSLEESQSPLFVLGQGCKEALKANDHFPLPYVTTILAKTNYHNDNYWGTIGILGDTEANQRLEAADLLICVGCRLSERSIQNNPRILEGKKIIYVTTSLAVCKYKNTLTNIIVCDSATFLDLLIPLISLSPYQRKDCSIAKPLNRSYEDFSLFSSEVFDVDGATKAILYITTQRDLICLDDGLYTLSFLKYYQQTSVIFWGSMAAGGSSIGAAIGAAVTHLYDRIFIIVGDGGILSVLGELQTPVKYGLPIAIIVYNNHGYRSIDSWSEGKYKQAFGMVDFSCVAAAFNLKYHLCSNTTELHECLSNNEVMLPCLIELELSQDYTGVQNHFQKRIRG